MTAGGEETPAAAYDPRAFELTPRLAELAAEALVAVIVATPD